MTHHQKMALVSLVVGLMVFSVFVVKMWVAAQLGRFDQPDAMQFLGRSVVILIAVAIALNIAGHIIFAILHSIATHDPSPDFTVDERDHAIELQGMKVSAVVTGSIVVLAFVFLALGWSVATVLILLICAFGIGDIIANAVKLYRYNWGF